MDFEDEEKVTEKDQNNTQTREQRKIVDGHGIIKYVNSATSVTVVGNPDVVPPPEIIIFFEGLESPRLRPRGESDPWAYTLREILRSFCIGKSCSYHTTADLPNV